MIKSCLNNIAHFWTYIVVGSYIFYLVAFLAGWARAVEGLNYFGTILGLFLAAILLPLGALYCRDRFDLVHLRDGTNAPSKIIWTFLLFSHNSVMTYAYITQVSQLFGSRL